MTTPHTGDGTPSDPYTTVTDQAGTLDTWFPLPLPPEQQVLSLFAAKWTIGALKPLVELRVFDELVEGPRTAEELASATNTDPDVMWRLLRAVAATGILHEHATTPTTYTLTRLSTGLCSKTGHSIRDMFLFASDKLLWQPYDSVQHSLHTGEPAFVKDFGSTFYEYTRAHPEAGDLLDRAMLQNSYPGTDTIFSTHDFGRFPVIADVGGGKGQFLAEILTRHPGSRGMLCDQPQVIADANETFEAAGLADRVTLHPTDFLTAVPAGADAYFTKHTLHNWSNGHTATIVANIRTAIGDNPNARLLILDMLLTAPGAGFDVGKLIDIESMTILGGQERSQAEWDEIAAKAGFAPVNQPEPGNLALLEYRPV